MPDLENVAQALLLTTLSNLFKGITFERGLFAHHFSASRICSSVTAFSRFVALNKSSKLKLKRSGLPGFKFSLSCSSTVFSFTGAVSC